MDHRTTHYSHYILVIIFCATQFIAAAQSKPTLHFTVSIPDTAKIIHVQLDAEAVQEPTELSIQILESWMRVVK